jgi:hypothetical protein
MLDGGAVFVIEASWQGSRIADPHCGTDWMPER